MLTEITVEQVLIDLKRVSELFATSGEGRDVDRLAQLVMQPFEVLQRRLDKPGALKLCYIDNPEASKTFSQATLDLIRKYCDGSIDKAVIAASLEATVEAYQKAFTEMGISPEISTKLFIKTVSSD